MPLSPEKERTRTVPTDVPSFLAYLPAFLVAGLKDFLDFPLFLISAIPVVGVPTAYLLDVIFGLFAIILILGMLLVFIGVGEALSVTRLLLLLLPGTAEAFLPGVNLLPGMIGAVFLIYRYDHLQAAARRTVNILTGKNA